MSMDPVETNPDHYRVVFENERVRVLEYTDTPGARSTPHEHPDSVMYALSSFRRRLYHGDQRRDLEISAGFTGGCRPSSTRGRTSATSRATRSSWSSRRAGTVPRRTGGSALLENPDLPRDLGAPALRALRAVGHTRLDQLAAVPRDELAKLHGVGPRALDRLQAALDARGLSRG